MVHLTLSLATLFFFFLTEESIQTQMTYLILPFRQMNKTINPRFLDISAPITDILKYLVLNLIR